MKTRKLTLTALMTAVALGIFVAEAQIPFMPSIPGIKLGLGQCGDGLCHVSAGTGRHGMYRPCAGYAGLLCHRTTDGVSIQYGWGPVSSLYQHCTISLFSCK